VFLKVLADLCSEIDGFKQKLQLKFAGVVDFTIVDKIKDYKLEENYVHLGFINRKAAIQLMLDSDLLLLPVNKAENAKGRLPGKIYENLRASKPIISLGIKGSDVEHILITTKTGFNFEYDDYEGIKNFILNVFNSSFTIAADKTEIEKYSVENQTQKVATWLSEISK
jgi:hypothetical protein